MNDQEPTILDIAKAAARAGNAGHWPTVAGILLDEVERLERQTSRIRKIVTWPKGTLPADPWEKLDDIKVLLSENNKCEHQPKD